MGNILENKIFISTRPESQSAELRSLLASESAQLLSMPTIEISPTKLEEQDLLQLKNIASFNWVVFTSPNGLKFFYAALLEVQNNYQLPRHLKIAVVGKKTASALVEYGATASFTNAGNTAEDFVADFEKLVHPGDRIFLPAGNLSRTIIKDQISKKAECIQTVLYETTRPKNSDERIVSRIINNDYDMIVLASPSACNNLLYLLSGKVEPTKLRLVCIGQTTASEVLKNNIKPLVISQIASAEGILSGIINYYKNQQL